ncbi:MAG: response regulator transcription factor [Nitrospirae bacterium]|nr:response regulator transcription factor [Nitrospirota bacterium]MBI3594092.1 response regulator transcription factor [Nitrospirota bacterium]
MKTSILIIDDDQKLNKLVVELLHDFGFETETAIHPEDGLKKLREKSPDLIILDVMLPGMNGFEVCKKIRQTSPVPIIMLTARGEVTDKIVGLELGADDYLPKPFEPRELIARIHTILRRTNGNVQTKIRQFGRLKVDFAKREAKLEDEVLELTTVEFATLVFLIKNKGKVLNRDEILEELRGIECEAFNRSVDITISRLRHKLRDDPKKPTFIKTVFGTGYLFIGGENEIEK